MKKMPPSALIPPLRQIKNSLADQKTNYFFRIRSCTFTKKLFSLSLIALFSVAHVFAQSPPPVISSFSPSTGPVGTSVTITGTGFNAAAAGNVVFFGATMATVTAASTTSLTVTVPVGATYQPISVLNGSTALIGYSAKPFVTTFTPNKGAITASDFMPSIAFNTGTGSIDVSISDLDGDGKPDLVLVNPAENTISVLRNTSVSGSITSVSFAPRVDFATGNVPVALVIGDLDGDGKPDLAVINGPDNTISVFRNTSTIGSITASSFAPGVTFATDAHPSRIAVGDMDGDGKADLVVVSSVYTNGNDFSTYVNTISVLRNTSTRGAITTASFAPAVDIFAGHGTDEEDIAIGDLDGDGKPDIVVSLFLLGEIAVFRNTSTPGSINNINSFASPVYFRTGSSFVLPFSVSIGDLDGDGKPDLVVVNTNSARNTIAVFRNTSTTGSITGSSFAPLVNFATGGGYATFTAIGDLDGDGKPDIAMINEDQNNVVVFHNTSSVGSIAANSFAPEVDFSLGYIPVYGHMAIGDLDGDGKPDLAASINTYNVGATVSILRNNPFFPPTVQATNVAFSGTTTNIATVSWTNGNGSSRAVFIAEASTGSPLPVNSTTYTANTVFGSGTQIGSSGWYCVYNGTGTTVNITGLSSGATYRVMTMEYNGGTGPQNYLTSTLTGNPANVTTIAGGPITINSISLVSSSLTNASSVQYTVTFGTAVTGLTTSNFALATTGSVSGAGISLVSGSGTSYTITVNTGTGDGTIGLNLANATGLTPGIITALPFAGSIYTIDHTPPAITVSSPSSSTIKSGTGQVRYSVTYADANFNTSTLSNSNITLNSTGTANGTISLSGSGTSYTVTVLGITGNGSLGISIAAGTASDLAGNIAATTSPSISFFVTPPLVGQSPNIAYGTGKVTITGTAPFSLQPTNTGGAVPQTIYGQVTTFAGSITAVAGYVNGNGTATQFNGPQQMARDASGNLYVADALNHAIRVISPAGAVSTFAGSTTGTPGIRDGADTTALFSYPDGIVIDGSGNLFVSDYNNNEIRKITPSGMVSTFYASPVTFGPGGLCFDASGNLIAAAQDAGQIIRITPAGVATTIAGSTIGYANGTGAAAQFNTPSDVRIDGSGNIYVADFSNNAIRKIDPAGVVTTIAGSTVSGNTPGFADGVGTAVVFNNPAGLLLGPGEVIYVADMYNNDIRRIMPDGTVTLIAGSAAQVPGNADGTGTAAGLNMPDYMYIDDTGTGYIAELEGNRVRKIVLTGYTLKGTLPAGLTFDVTTGIISGVAAAPFTAQTDTVTAYNAFGYSSAIITLSYQLPSTIATLSNLRLSSGTLTPVFVSGTTSYTASVGNAVTNIAVTPTTTDAAATVTVNGIDVVSCSPSAGVPLTVGVNSITVVVTNATTSKTYTVTVTRLASDYAYLANLKLSSGTLSPSFVSATLTYTARVSRATYNITVTPTTVYSFETIKINGVPIASGTSSSSIPLMDGLNNISVVVTAQNGTHARTYTVIVTKEPGAAKGFYQPANVNSEPIDDQFAVNGVKVHLGVSPNGDGINDVLMIEGITAYPENKLLIVNRNGIVVFETEGYNNSSRVFDGHSSKNGAMQEPGTYYYSLEYTAGNEKKYSIGFFILKY
jgi:gliding motility-associated-like protein